MSNFEYCAILLRWIR